MKPKSFLFVLLSVAGASLAAAQTSVAAWAVWPTASYSGVNASTGTGVIATTSGASVAYSADYIYTFMASPTLTLTTDTLADVSTITLEIVLAGGTGGDSLLVAPTLDFGSSFDLATGVTITPTGGNVLGNASSSHVYTWDVSGLTGGSTFDIVWRLNTHSAVSSVVVTQNVSAVPEPSAFAALAGFGALGCATLRRRRA